MRRVFLMAAVLTVALGILVPAIAEADPGSHPGAGHQISGTYKGKVVTCDPPASPFTSSTIVYQRPGLTIRRYQRHGGSTMYALTARVYGHPRMRPGPLLRGPLTRLEPLVSKFSTSRAYAAVNGNFFDWGQSWASLGPEVLRGRVIKGVSNPQNAWIDSRDGHASRGQVWLSIRVFAGKAWVQGQSYNSQFLARDGVTVFDTHWGLASRKWLHPTQRLHEVIVAKGKVIAESNRITAKPVPSGGYVIVGQGKGATDLDRAGLHLHRAMKVSVGLHSTSRNGVDSAIGVGLGLLHGGQYFPPACVADRPLARTILGISADGTKVIAVTCLGSIDGGKKGTAGLSLRGSAAVMKALGAADASMLDGGGSTGMVVATPRWKIVQLTRSSDGFNRHIPEGYAFWPY